MTARESTSFDDTVPDVGFADTTLPGAVVPGAVFLDEVFLDAVFAVTASVDAAFLGAVFLGAVFFDATFFDTVALAASFFAAGFLLAATSPRLPATLRPPPPASRASPHASSTRRCSALRPSVWWACCPWMPTRRSPSSPSIFSDTGVPLIVERDLPAADSVRRSTQSSPSSSSSSWRSSQSRTAGRASRRKLALISARA